jgi:hypothetical protein
MTVSSFTFDAAEASGEYRPGVCNIGTAEIARRRMAGHTGLAATIGLLALLVVIDAPPVARLLLVLPATISTSGYLQARLRFCAGFGSRGIFNFGSVGETAPVVDADARALDRRRSGQISLASLAVGIAVGAVATLLPV